MTTEAVAVTPPGEVKQDKGTYIAHTVEIDKNAESAGLTYSYIQFKTVQDAVNFYTNRGDNGEEIVKNLFNRALRSSMKNKAKGKVTEEGELEKFRKSGNTCLLTVEEAEAFTPGSRDVVSVSGLQSELKDIQKELIKCKEALAKLKTESPDATDKIQALETEITGLKVQGKEVMVELDALLREKLDLV